MGAFSQQLPDVANSLTDDYSLALVQIFSMPVQSLIVCEFLYTIDMVVS